MARLLIAVALMAIVTYIPRVLPIAAFKNRIGSRRIRSFLYYVPYAVLGAMIFPGVLYSTNHFETSLMGMATALILAYFERGLMTVAITSILVVLLGEILLKYL